MLNQNKIAVVIPYYNASKHIENVIDKLPTLVDKVYIVNDKSPEELPESLLKKNKIIIIKHDKNLGVGGATKTGFKAAIKDQVDIVLKVDADDQMDLTYIKSLLEPLISNTFEYAKGNRFKNFKALKKMPFARKFGNVILSFLTKASTGYWNNFDPTNGFFAIKTTSLKELDFNNLSNRYYFETSLIAELYFQHAKIKDVSMPAIYGDEKSSMQVWKMPFVFLPRLIKTFINRLFKIYFIYDFSMSSIYLIFGAPLFVFGLFYGLYNWWFYASKQILAPTGTIMLITLTIIIGFQLLLQFINNDIDRSPK